MDWLYTLTIALSFGFLLILLNHMKTRPRKLMRGFIVFMAIFLMIRYALHGETLLGYIIALLIAYFYWLLIGRYNLAKDDDKTNEIKVYGLND